MTIATQARAAQWIMRCFGARNASDPVERGRRLVEEALEAGQAVGVPEAQARLILERVYSRAPGIPAQELGGVQLTLFGLGEALDIQVSRAFENELSRVSSDQAMERVRQKHAEKARAGTADPLEGL